MGSFVVFGMGQDTSQKESGMNQLISAKGVMAVKMFARDLEKVVAGSPVYVSRGKDLPVLKSMVMEDWDSLAKRVARSTLGVTGTPFYSLLLPSLPFPFLLLTQISSCIYDWSHGGPVGFLAGVWSASATHSHWQSHQVRWFLPSLLIL